MQLVDVIQEQLSNLRSIVRMFDWDKVAILGELINDHQDCIIFFALGKTTDGIHTNRISRLFRYWKSA